MQRQMRRLRDYAAARGYQVVAEVTEIASGLNDERPKLKKLLTDAKVGVIVVEHRDRLTRFGYGYITALLEHEGRRVEAIYPSDTSQEDGQRSGRRFRGGHHQHGRTHLRAA